MHDHPNTHKHLLVCCHCCIGDTVAKRMCCAATCNYFLQLALILLPLGDKPPAWAGAILRYSIQSAVKFFPMRLVSESAHLDTKRPYIVGANGVCFMAF